VATKTNNAGTQATVGFNWTIHVANQGVGPASFPANSVVLTDNLHNSTITYNASVPVSNLSGVTGTLACAIASFDLTCSVTGGPLVVAVGGSFDVTITATPNQMGTYYNPRPGGVCLVDPNNVVTETNSGGTAEQNNGCSNSVTFIDSFDLTVGITSNPLSFTKGQEGATYSVLIGNSSHIDLIPAPATVANAKPAPATTGQVTVVLTLPPGLTATGISGSGWACDLASLTCTRIDALAGGNSYPPIILTVNVANNAPATVAVTAVVSDPNEPVANRGNNTATAVTPVGVPAADLSLTKTADPINVLPNANVTYTMTLRNNGPDAALNVVLTDPIAANTTFVSAVAPAGFNVATPAVGAGPPAVVTFTAPSLANGATATFTVTARVNASAPAGSVVNVASVSTISPDPNPANNIASATVAVGLPTPTATSTSTPSPFVPPVVPQVFQNPAVQGIFQAGGNRATPTPRAPAPAVAALPASGTQPIVLRPPSTGDAGLLRLPSLW